MRTSQPTPIRITLDQLLALNDEIVALTRAGVPLERGLIDLGQDLPGRLGKIATELGRRLDAGESLVGIVKQTDSGFPAAYAAVLEAGLRSGRLSSALEAMSSSLRRVKETRRLLGASLLYPILLIGFAYFLFVWMMHSVVPTIVGSFHEFEIEGGWLVAWLANICQSVPYWWPWPPVIGVILFAIFWLRERQASFSGGLGTVFPSLWRLSQASQLAAFAEILRLLVQHDVPLDEALVLAADGSANRKLKQAAGEFAEQLQRGGEGKTVPANFPPLLGWLIGTMRQQGALLNALHEIAKSCRKRAQRLNDSVAVYLPIFLAVGVGVTAIAVLAASILGPWYMALIELANP